MAETTAQSNVSYKREPLWHVELAVVIALGLQLLLPDQFIGAPKYVLLILEALLLGGLAFSTPKAAIFQSVLRRVNAISLIALVSLANIYGLERVAHELLLGGRITNGGQLILASINIYLTNIILFGLWYWEMDGGGPGQRLSRPHHRRDFVFPQMATPHLAASGWRPTFFDYLYVSSTNAMAFSPTDTMPLSQSAKLLMLAQATVSLVTIALVAARAVNILS